MSNQKGLNSVLQEKFNNRIGNGLIAHKPYLDKIEREGTLLNDFIIDLHDGKLSFFPYSGNVNMQIEHTAVINKYSMHVHAVYQAGEKLGIPPTYLRDLAMSKESWKIDLASNILNEHSVNGYRDRVLIREIGGEVRGILSDQYRRLNTSDIYKSFLTAVGEQGGVVYSAFADDTRSFIEVAYPELQTITTPKNGDVAIGFGMRIANSDFGDGALDLRAFIIQGVCLNGMVLESKIREIHLGSRLPNDIRLSEQTYKRDTQLQASLAHDLVKTLMSPTEIRKRAELIVGASSKEVNLVESYKQLPKQGLNKTEVEEVKEVISNNRVEDGVQGENTLFKLAQAIGAVARNKQERRKRDLQEIAGKILLKAEG